MSGELIDLDHLPPLPVLSDDPAPHDAPQPPPSAEDAADPIKAMERHLRFYSENERVLADAIAAIGDDPRRAAEAQVLKRQFIACVDRGQKIAEALAPYRAPRMQPTTYQPKPEAAASGALQDAISDDMSGIEAAEVYRRLVRGGA
jgi:hypothetical protein